MIPADELIRRVTRANLVVTELVTKLAATDLTDPNELNRPRPRVRARF